MMEAKSKLQTNFIGRLLGIDSIGLENTKLIALKKGSIVSSISVDDTTDFATYKRGIFGGSLVLRDGYHVRNFRFLKPDGAIDFLDSLNRLIAKNITETIYSSFETFTNCVFKKYPRDSKIDLLSNLCSSIAEKYDKQNLLWDKYIAQEQIDKVKELISYNPVDSSELRKQHETIFLEKRKQFFDRVESNPLTNEQRLGVLRSNDKNMVLAVNQRGKFACF